jgi:hypothetical protein
MTIAKLLKHDFKKDYMLQLYDSEGNLVYTERGNGYWEKFKYDSEGNQIYWEDSDGDFTDPPPKESCNNKVIEIDGKKYKLEEIEGK